MMAEGMEEKARAFLSDPPGFVAVAVAQVEHGKRHVGVDRVSHRLGLGFDNPVVLFGVPARFVGRDEAESQRAQPELRRDPDHLQASHSGGWGFWRGLGITLRTGACTYLPLWPWNGSSTIIRTTTS